MSTYFATSITIDMLSAMFRGLKVNFKPNRAINEHAVSEVSSTSQIVD